MKHIKEDENKIYVSVSHQLMYAAYVPKNDSKYFFDDTDFTREDAADPDAYDKAEKASKALCKYGIPLVYDGDGESGPCSPQETEFQVMTRDDFIKMLKENGLDESLFDVEEDNPLFAPMYENVNHKISEAFINKAYVKRFREEWGEFNNGEFAVDPDFDRRYLRPDPDFDMQGRHGQIAYCLDDIGPHYVDKADAYKMYIENCGLRQEEAKENAEKFEDEAPDRRFYSNGKLDQLKLITYFDDVYTLDWPLFDIEANRSDEDIDSYCGPKEYIRRLLDDAKNDDDVDLTNDQAISNTIEAYDTLIYDTLYGESLSNIEDDLKKYATDSYPHIKRAYAIICDWKKELEDVKKGKFSESKSSVKESLIPSGFKYKKSDFTSYIKRLNKIFSDALGFGVKLVDKWPGSDFEGRFRLVPVDVEEAKQKSGFKDTYYITEYGFEFGAASDLIEALYQSLKDKLDIYETDTYKDSDKHSFLTISLGEDEPDIDIRRESELNYSVCVEFEERNKAWNMNQYGTVYDYSGTPEARENNKKFSSDYYGTGNFNGKSNLYRIATKKFVLVSDYNEGDDNNRITSKPMSASQAIEAYYNELNGNPNNEKAIKDGILDIYLKVYGERSRVDVKDVEKAVELYGKSKATWKKRYPGDEAQVWVHPKYRK